MGSGDEKKEGEKTEERGENKGEEKQGGKRSVPDESE